MKVDVFIFLGGWWLCDWVVLMLDVIALIKMILIFVSPVDNCIIFYHTTKTIFGKDQRMPDIFRIRP